MTRIAIAFLGLSLAGTVASGPPYLRQKLAAVQGATTQDEADASAQEVEKDCA